MPEQVPEELVALKERIQGQPAEVRAELEPLIDEVMEGSELTLKFNDPNKDSRTPDVMVQPIYGTIYTTSTKKNAEHGGFSFGDTNVGLIVSNPGLPARVLKTPVATSQVAASIVKALGINPNTLKSVDKEKTELQPGLPF